MNEKTKHEYMKTARSFIKTRLTDKGLKPTEKNIRHALIASAPDYRPGYWRKVRCALVAQQTEAGFTKTACAIKEVKNPVTASDAPVELKARKKAKQKRRKHVEKEEHILLRDTLKHKKDFAVLAAIEIARVLGCRPAEMLTIKLLGNNKIFIEGAKKTENGLRGLDRTITLSARDYSTVSYHKANFFDETHKNGCDAERVMHRIQHRLATATKKLWPRRKHQITLYSYRHQMGSDLKASNRSPEEIAAIMGHQSVDSVGVYGNKRRSSRHLSIKATTESIAGVRKTHPKNPNFITHKKAAMTMHLNRVPQTRIVKL